MHGDVMPDVRNVLLDLIKIYVQPKGIWHFVVRLVKSPPIGIFPEVHVMLRECLSQFEHAENHD